MSFKTHICKKFGRSIFLLALFAIKKFVFLLCCYTIKNKQLRIHLKVSLHLVGLQAWNDCHLQKKKF